MAKWNARKENIEINACQMQYSGIKIKNTPHLVPELFHLHWPQLLKPGGASCCVDIFKYYNSENHDFLEGYCWFMHIMDGSASFVQVDASQIWG